MKMKVLLLGANGMLGKSLYKALSYITNMDIVTVARNNADYTLDLLDDAKLKDHNFGCSNAIEVNYVL